MAETNALLKRHTGNRIEGSNPSVSANMVVLDLGGGCHAFHEHLAPGSVRVAKRDRVTRGQVLAQVGLTGQGSEPLCTSMSPMRRITWPPRDCPTASTRRDW